MPSEILACDYYSELHMPYDQLGLASLRVANASLVCVNADE